MKLRSRLWRTSSGQSERQEDQGGYPISNSRAKHLGDQKQSLTSPATTPARNNQPRAKDIFAWAKEDWHQRVVTKPSFTPPLEFEEEIEEDEITTRVTQQRHVYMRWLEKHLAADTLQQIKEDEARQMAFQLIEDDPMVDILGCGIY